MWHLCASSAHVIDNANVKLILLSYSNVNKVTMGQPSLSTKNANLMFYIALGFVTLLQAFSMFWPNEFGFNDVIRGSAMIVAVCLVLMTVAFVLHNKCNNGVVVTPAAIPSDPADNGDT